MHPWRYFYSLAPEYRRQLRSFFGARIFWRTPWITVSIFAFDPQALFCGSLTFRA